MGSRPNRGSKISAWLHTVPLLIWLLGFGSLVNIAGLSLLWPVNAIYIHTVLGKPMTVAGFVLMLYSGAGFLGSSLGGWLFDKLGALPVLVLGLLVSGVSILVPVFVPGWMVYVAVLLVFGTSSSMAFPVLSALAGRVWPDGGRRAFNFLYVSNNLGVALGTAVGGLLAAWSFRGVFLGITCANIVFLCVVLFALAPRLSKTRSVTKVSFGPVVNSDEGAFKQHEEALSSISPVPLSQESWQVVPWGTILIVLLGFVAAWSVYVQWQSSISVYMQTLGFPLASYSILWTINGLLIFAAQPLVSFVTTRLTSLGGQMLTGIVMYAVAFSLLVEFHEYVVFVVAMVITTLGEVFVWPAVPALVARLSPSHRLGLLQGFVQSGATLGRMIGPLAGGWLYDNLGVHSLLSIMVPALILPLLCFVWVAKLEKPHLTEEPTMHA